MATAALTSACIFLVLDGVGAFVPSSHAAFALSSPHTARTARGVQPISRRPIGVSMSMPALDDSTSRTGFLEDSSTAMAAAALVVATSVGLASPAEAAQVSAWEQINLPVASVLYDIAFDPVVPAHGLVVGAQGTFLEVKFALHWGLCISVFQPLRLVRRCLRYICSCFALCSGIFSASVTTYCCLKV